MNYAIDAAHRDTCAPQKTRGRRITS
jgi:hypothetical protein